MESHLSRIFRIFIIKFIIFFVVSGFYSLYCRLWKISRHFPQFQVTASDYQGQCQNHSEAAAWGVLKKGVHRNSTKFTGKHLRQSLFFNKVAGLWCATLLKKKLWHMCFPVNFVKFLRTLFLQSTSGRLLLIIDLTGQKHTFADPEATVWRCSSK